jgi:type IV pilus assembly protein PilP
MNARKLVLIVLVSAVTAAAQTAPPSQRVAPEPARPKKASPFAAAPMRKAATHRPAAAPRTTAAVRKPAGKRDPFVSPVREGGGNGPSCTVGKKCLAIDSVVLKGIVTATAGSIAVVVNSRNATYFLRENDPVFNGYVVKITPDSIVFRETVMDRVGKTTTRDVVKRVSAPAV